MYFYSDISREVKRPRYSSVMSVTCFRERGLLVVIVFADVKKVQSPSRRCNDGLSSIGEYGRVQSKGDGQVKATAISPDS